MINMNVKLTRRRAAVLRPFAGLLVAACGLLWSVTSFADDLIVNVELKGGIGVATAEYVIKAIDHANSIDASLVLISTDTPGGLVSATRDIIQNILASEVPVATYVTPAGARADSAGTYILLASHIAAMAPTTHLGAATPVSMTGDGAVPSPDDFSPGPADGQNAEEPASAPDAPPQGSAMERKVLNDAVAYIRTLAERHDRNADWAELAVTEAATLTAREALAENVVEYVVTDVGELFAAINGLSIDTAGGTVTVSTSEPVVEDFAPSWRLQLLMVISQPEILLLLGLVGVYGLILEGWNPGALLPGTLGAICLLLALYGSQTIPINYAGIALILLGIGLMVAEAFAPSFGILGIGGTLAFVFGAILTFDSGVPGFQISITFVISLAVASALFLAWVMTYLMKLRKRGAVYGRESIVGGTGVATEAFVGEGRVWLQGEAWGAHASVPIAKGQRVRVTAMNGLILTVEPQPGDDASPGRAT